MLSHLVQCKGWCSFLCHYSIKNRFFKATFNYSW